MKAFHTHRMVAVAMLMASAFLSPSAWAHSHKVKGLEIVHPWCFATGDAVPDSVNVYMLIKNRTRRTETLIGATSAHAQRIDIRQPERAKPTTAAAAPVTAIKPEGAAARAGVTVKAGHEVALRRDGAHLVLTGIKPLAPYDSFLMTLEFARAGKIEVEVVVEEVREPK